MYRIEVRPGEEAVFRNIEELATGIRNGFITRRARIWHAASEKWLPVEFHPHYKKALAGDFTPAAPKPQPSLAAMPTPALTPVPTPVPSAIVAMREAVTAPPAAVPPVTHAEIETADPVDVTAAEPEPEPEVEPEPPAAEPDPADQPPLRRHTPVEVFDAVRPEPEPELVLPKINYPEVPPMEESAELPTARRSRRSGGRPLLLIGSAAAVVFGAQALLGSRSGAHQAAGVVAEPPARVEPVPAASRPQERPAAPAPPKPVATQAPSPRTPAPAPAAAPPVAMVPGPAFAPSVPARPGDTRLERQPAPSPEPSPAPPAATAAVAAPAPSIAPAPETIELDLPAAAVADSLAPGDPEQRDSLAIKRILKAVSGKKPVVLPGQ